MEPPKIKAIEDAAEAYIEIRNKRMDLSKKEHDARVGLEAIMKSNKQTEYHFDSYIVVLLKTEKAKVKTAGSDDDEDEEDGDEE